MSKGLKEGGTTWYLGKWPRWEKQQVQEAWTKSRTFTGDPCADRRLRRHLAAAWGTSGGGSQEASLETLDRLASGVGGWGKGLLTARLSQANEGVPISLKDSIFVGGKGLGAPWVGWDALSEPDGKKECPLCSRRSGPPCQLGPGAEEERLFLRRPPGEPALLLPPTRPSGLCLTSVFPPVCPQPWPALRHTGGVLP